MSDPSPQLVEQIVRRVLAEMSAAAPAPTPAAPPPKRIKPSVLIKTLGLVVERPDAKVETALASAARSGIVFAPFGDSDCPICNARDMCRALAAGELAGGVIIDKHAAGAMALAGKIRGVRPVQGLCAAAVEAGLRHFDANVLVIGHATVSMYEIRSMIDRFSTGRRMDRPRTKLLEAIEELES